MDIQYFVKDLLVKNSVTRPMKCIIVTAFYSFNVRAIKVRNVTDIEK